MAQQDDVVELYLTEVAEDRRPLWDDLVELPRYVESVRVDMAAFRGFLTRLGVHRILAEATRVRVVGTVRDDIHDHRVPDRVITLHLGGLLKGIDRARRADPGLTDAVAAERLARAMSDAMIHLGGHLSSDVAASTPLDRDVTFAGKVGKAIGFLIGIGVTAVFVALLAFEETYMYLFIAEIFAFPYLGYRAGRYVGEQRRLSRQFDSGARARAIEVGPTMISEVYADEPPFVTVTLRPLDTWPD